MDIIKIETKRTILRNFKTEDLNDLFTYFSQDGVCERAGLKSCKTKEEAKQMLDHFIKHKNILAIELKSLHKVVGHISINDDSEDNKADVKELGFVLNKEFWGNKIMKEVVKSVLDYLFTKRGINYVYACCFNDNLRSKGLIESCGFTFEKEGTYYAKQLAKTYDTLEYVYKKSDD